MKDIDELFQTRARLLNEVETLSMIADSTSDKAAAEKARKAVEGTFAMLNIVDTKIAALNRELENHQ